MKHIRGLAAVALVGGCLGASIGMAGPASADPINGAYTGTILDAGTSDLQQGGTAPFTLDPCGPGCIHLVQTGSGWELHRQGTIWTETDARGTATLDEGTLVLHLVSAAGNSLVIGLTKDA